MAYLGQICLFGFGFRPEGFEFCQGQLLSIKQNVPLFSILGNIYGGDGHTNFRLPNLEGVPVGAGHGPGLSLYELGNTGGQAAVTLTEPELPAHRHSFRAVGNQADSSRPDGSQLARAYRQRGISEHVANFYSDNASAANTALARNAIAPHGSGQPHNNMQPYLALNYCIALQGDYPPRDGGGPVQERPFLGEIALCAFGFQPRNWALCDGRLLPIRGHQALFALLGPSFGGDGTSNFALPDLRSRAPLGLGVNRGIGERGGEEAHTLSDAEMPSHGHALMADATSTTGIGDAPTPAMVLGRSSGVVLPGKAGFTANLYASGAANAVLAGQSISSSGGDQSHENRMPSLALSFCINLDGPFPTRT
jgi:microcystin-dependent protein